MNSRERIWATLSHTEPDCVPFDLGGSHIAGIAAKAYTSLCTREKIAIDELRLCDMIQQLARPSEFFLERFGVDTRGLYPLCSHNIPLPMHSERWWKYHRKTNHGWQYRDEWGIVYFFPSDGLYYSIVDNPLSGMDITPEKIDELTLPRGDEPWRLEGLPEQAKRYRDAKKAVVLKSICAGLFEMGQRICGTENFLCSLLTSPSLAHRIMDRILEIKLCYWKKVLSRIGDMVDVVVETDDYGTQNSLLVSPRTFREIIKPKLRDLIRHIKQISPNVRVLFHSCGSIFGIIPDLVEIGVDILNPVHLSAAGMDPARLKKDFGNDIAFWGGGVDTQSVLPHRRPGEIRDSVKRNIDTLAPGGGWVFSAVHNIQADCPPENIMAMWEALQEFGRHGGSFHS